MIVKTKKGEEILLDGCDLELIADIMVNRRRLHLGIFDTIEEATGVRRAAELEHWGEACPA